MPECNFTCHNDSSGKSSTRKTKTKTKTKNPHRWELHVESHWSWYLVSDRCWTLSYDLVFSSVVRRMALWDSCNLWSSERRNEHCGSQYWCPECQHPQKVTIISTLLCPPMISVSRNSSCCPCSALIPCHFCFYLLPFFSFPFPCLLPKFIWTARSTLWLKIRNMIF